MTENYNIKSGLSIIQKSIEILTESPGIYRMVNNKNEILYIGKARNLKKRVIQYTKFNDLPHRLKSMIAQVSLVETTITKTEAEALLLEANLIKKFQPRYNIMLKDDKSFPYIRIGKSDHKFPKIEKYRGSKTNDAYYFGPFTSVDMVYETISILRRAFLLRSCSDNVFASRTRPCLEYQIKRCSAPCVGKITKEDYDLAVKRTCNFLSGKNREIQQIFLEEMNKASQNLEYEKAASYRDRIKALTQIQSRQRILPETFIDADVVGLYRDKKAIALELFIFRAGQYCGSKSYFPRHAEDYEDHEIIESLLGRIYQTDLPPKLIIVSHPISEKELLEEALSNIAKDNVKIFHPQKGEKYEIVKSVVENAKEALSRKIQEEFVQTNLLNEVAKLFSIEDIPSRIEIYDNSHISGQNAIGAMVVAGQEGFIKKDYRHFNIALKQIKGGDDYAMLEEVLRRRFGKLKSKHPEKIENIWPDLVLIDGGKGQLGVAEKVFADLGINDVTLVAIAKGPDRNAGREEFHIPGKLPFRLPANDPVLFYLQRLRDEAHRFAITSHRHSRSRSTSKSLLDQIPGIGRFRKKSLLQFFGSLKSIESADIEALSKVPGINKKTAEHIYNHLHHKN